MSSNVAMRLPPLLQPEPSMFSSLPSHALLLMNLNSWVPGGTSKDTLHVPSPLSIKGVPAGSQPWNEPAKCTPSGETLDTTLMSAVNVTTKGATQAVQEP